MVYAVPQRNGSKEMIRVSIDVSVQRTVQLKQFEPLVISATSNITLEGDESMPEIFATEATLLRALVDAQLEPNLRQRMEQNTATNTANDNTATNWPGEEYGDSSFNQDVEEYDDLPFSDEGPSQAAPPRLRVEHGTNDRGEYWKVGCPIHGKEQKDGMTYARMWPAGQYGPANVKCSKNTNGEWCKFSVPADKAWAIVNGQSNA